MSSRGLEQAPSFDRTVLPCRLRHFVPGGNIEDVPRQVNLDDIDRLILSVPTDALAARLRRARVRLGLSIRDLATAAGVNKNSIIRLEKGLPPQPATVRKICAAMGLHVRALLAPLDTDAGEIAIHRKSDNRWYDLTAFEAGPIVEAPLTLAERRKLARKGVVAPMLMLTNRLKSGNLMPNLIELFGATETHSHPGEEMVYVLEGRVVVWVGDRSFELEAGEAISFWSSEPHRYLPAEGSRLPVRILSIATHTV